MSTIGIDKVNKEVNMFNKVTGTGNKRLDALNNGLTKTSGAAIKTGKEFKNTEQAIGKATATTDKYTKSTGNANKNNVDGARRVRALAFSFTGLGVAMTEAVGLLGSYQASVDKVNSLQDRVNKLMEEGKQGTREYDSAVRQLEDAQRGLNFMFRNMILSFTDMIPFTLLIVNEFVKIRSSSNAARNALQGQDTATKTLTISNNALATSNSRTLIPSVDGVKKSFLGIEKKTVDVGGKFTKIGSTIRGKLVGAFSKLGAGAKGALANMLGFVTNPIGAAIAAIGVVIGALAFDVGGLRTKMNELGVAIGDQIPIFKPFLKFLGMIGEGLGFVGDSIKNFLGLGDAVDDAGDSAAGASDHFRELNEIMNKSSDPIETAIKNFKEFIKIESFAGDETSEFIKHIEKWQIKV